MMSLTPFGRPPDKSIDILLSRNLTGKSTATAFKFKSILSDIIYFKLIAVVQIFI